MIYEPAMVLELLAKSSVFVLIGFLINRGWYARQPTRRGQVWRVVFVAILCIPLFGNLIPHWGAWESSVTIELTASPTTIPETVDHSSSVPTVLPAPAQAHHESAYSLANYVLWMGWVVFILIVLYYLVGHLYMGWILRGARPAQDPQLLTTLARIRTEMGISATVHLRTSRWVKGPLSYGLFKRFIVLPESYTPQEQEIRFILFHELAHIKRGDLPMQCLVQFVVALCWFNPLVWIAYRRFKLDCELACDCEVVKSEEKGSDYATFLLEVARNTQQVRFSPSTLYMAKKSALEGRLLAILNYRRGVSASLGPLLLSGAMVLAVSGFTIQQTTRSTLPQDEKAYIVQHLKGVLHDDDLEVRIEALRAIDEIGGLASLADLLGESTDHDAALIKRAVSLVIGMEAESSVEQLITSGDKKVQKNVIKALERLKAQETVRLMTLALQDSDPDIREHAADALSAMNVLQAVPLLIQALNDPNDDVRAEAADGLGDIRAQAAIPHLLNALNDPDDDVREEAVCSLGQIGDSQTIPLLVAKLHDPDRSVREAAIAALGTMKDKTALEPLLNALNDPDKKVRREAIVAIRELFE